MNFNNAVSYFPKSDFIELTTFEQFYCDGGPFKLKLFISADEIASLFEVDSASGPTFNNGKYIFELSNGDIVFIDTSNPSRANLLETNYSFDEHYLRQNKLYSFKHFEKIHIVISYDNIPYGLFAHIDKSWPLGRYRGTGIFVLMNLKTGELHEYSYSNLPSFVIPY